MTDNELESQILTLFNNMNIELLNELLIRTGDHSNTDNILLIDRIVKKAFWEHINFIEVKL